MVVAVDMKERKEEGRVVPMESKGDVVNSNHLPILKGILDGVVDYHNAPVRFGRVPKREKARILAAMHQSCQSRSAERAAVAEQLTAASQMTNASGSASTGESGAPANQGVPHAEGESKEEPGPPEWKEQGTEEVDGQEEELEANRLANTVLRAHSDTCHFAHLRPKEGPRASGGPVYSVQGRNGPILACPLNPRRPLVAGLTPDPNGRGEDTLLQDFSQRFSPAIRGVVEFAKRIPGFALLSQSDQVTLLKAGVFEVLLLRLACLFDAQSNTMTCLNGELLRRESIVSHSPSSSPSQSPNHSSNARFLVDSMFEFAARLNSLQLSDAELALFSAVVIIAPDRPGLRHTDLISRIHTRLLSSLSLLLSHSHPSQSTPPALLATLQSYIPDLRTLNTLHSEKLLAFKMTEQQNHSSAAAAAASAASVAEEYPPRPLQQHQEVLQGESWKDDEVQEVEEEEMEEEERWRASSRSANMSAVISGLKSPLGSVSSSESVCSGEVAALSEFRTSASASAPLLAATLSGTVPPTGGFPKRRRLRDRSGSNSEEDTSCSGHQPATVVPPHRTYFRKLDSPSDSGIESGTERLEKSSTSTSVCSSPRSSLEDKDEALLHKMPPQRRCPHSAVEDMPVLKRVLQAPPLYDTNSLMDEAYKPHKKFRALRKDCAEGEVSDRRSYGGLEPVQETLSPPPVVVLSPPASASPQSIISTLNVHFPQISIQAQPMREPSPVESHSSNPPLLLQKALLQPPANQRSLQSHQHQALLSALSGEPPAGGNSSLSSTHSTLARSLMEGPKMTAEQMKRTDIIHSYIMREGAEESYRPSQGYQGKGDSGYRMQQKEVQGSQGVLVFNGSYMGWSKQEEYVSQPPKQVLQPQEHKQAGGQPLNLSKKTPPSSPAASVLEA